MSDKLKLVTHSGRFHADDAFATAVLSLLFEGQGKSFEIIRSRDPKEQEGADILYDTGNKYSPDEKVFDHHQEGGAGERGNGVPYAAFGLIWKHYGKELIQTIFGEDFSEGKISSEDLEKIHKLFDEGFVQPIDASDTGYEDYKSTKNNKLQTYMLDDVAKSFIPTNSEGYEKSQELFMQLVELYKQIVKRQLIKTKNKVEVSKGIEEIYNNTEDKRIIVLESGGSWRDVLISKPEPLFVVFPTIDDDGWIIQAVYTGLSGYEVRKFFPESWRGKTDKSLEKETGIEGSKFCHLEGFLCVTKTKEEAIELAKIAADA